MTSPDTGPVITTDLVSLDADLPAEKEAVLTELAELQVKAGRASETTQLLADIHAREEEAATGLPGGIAIPHCRTTAVSAPSLGFARLRTPTDFGAGSGDDGTDLVFMILAPEGGGSEHMKVLSTLARSLVKKDFVAALRSAESEEEIVTLVTDILDKKKTKKPAAATAAAPAAASASEPEAEPAAEPEESAGVVKLVGITSCPTGIAHTYMAADA
ncbi:MAG: fructose PTS transporter subunit IIA, partial [Mycobacteriaceae bacterium]